MKVQISTSNHLAKNYKPFTIEFEQIDSVTGWNDNYSPAIFKDNYRNAAKMRGAKHFAGKKISCLCCHRDWDIGNYAQHIRKNK